MVGNRLTFADLCAIIVLSKEVMNMLYTYSELLNIEKTRYNIEKKVLNKELYKVDKNIYSDKEVVDPILIYAKKYPSAIITLDNAYYYYGLTDVIPSKYYFATKHKAKQITNNKIDQVFTTDKLLEIGKTKVLIDGVSVNMYDKERLLIELVRRKKSLPLDYYKEIINNYSVIVYELSMKKIEEYASHFSIEEHILDAISMEVL